jgi:hypothetical protein
LHIREGGDEEKVVTDVTKNTQDYNMKDILFKPRYPGCVLRGGAPRQHKATASVSDTPDGSGRFSHNGTEGPCALTATRTANNKSVSWGSKCKQFCFLLRTVIVVQQFMTESNGAVSEEKKIVVIIKIILNLLKQNDH